MYLVRLSKFDCKSFGEEEIYIRIDPFYRREEISFLEKFKRMFDIRRLIRCMR